jgi:hypothetical protein
MRLGGGAFSLNNGSCASFCAQKIALLLIFNGFCFQRHGLNALLAAGVRDN